LSLNFVTGLRFNFGFKFCTSVLTARSAKAFCRYVIDSEIASDERNRLKGKCAISEILRLSLPILASGNRPDSLNNIYARKYNV